MLAGARRGFRARFERLVDPGGVLDPIERAKRADRARRAHMLTLAARSAEVRRTPAQRRLVIAVVDAAKSETKLAAADVQSPAAAETEGHGNDRPSA